MKYASKIFVMVLVAMFGVAWTASAQQDTIKQEAEYMFDKNASMMKDSEKPRMYHIRKVNFHGAKNISENSLRTISGLIPGDTIYLPSNYISNSITRLWAQRFFADVKIGASIDGDSVDMEIFLKERPRVHTWNFVGEGIGNSKKKELAEKLQLRRNSELSDYVIDKNEKLIKKEFADKVDMSSVVCTGNSGGGMFNMKGELIGIVNAKSSGTGIEGLGFAWEEVEKATQKAVQKRCAELADYKRPRKVVISKEPLERTSVGKIRRVTYKGQLDE